MKVATSASYYNCPAVAEILHSCDVVFTTNPYAAENFKHKDIRLANPGRAHIDDKNCIGFSELHDTFNKWVAETATDEELEDWYEYFRSTDAGKIRNIAAGSVSRVSSRASSGRGD